MTISIKELTNHSYIDHQLSASLDSTDAFEGPEKLLEIWFFPNAKQIPDQTKTLRKVPVETWVSILKLVQCEVLSIKSTSVMDAFLLSESSLFVYDHKLTLKTCGTTTTLFCLEKLFDIIKDTLGWETKNIKEGKYQPYKVFYSRRAFMFPLKQRSIHKNWVDEVEYLNKFFCFGKSYLVGRNDQDDHWHLYVTDTKKLEDSEVLQDGDVDETMEILMTGLDPKCAEQFLSNRDVKESDKKEFKKDDEADDEGHLLGYNMTKKTSLDQVYDIESSKTFHHDAFAFSPCGYSSNMIIDNQYYYTLHVTPEKGWSYASFESNVPVREVSGKKQDNVEVLKRVLKVFKPKDFCLTFFSKEMSDDSFAVLMKHAESIPDYKKKDKIIYDLEDYQLLYLRFEREEL